MSGKIGIFDVIEGGNTITPVTEVGPFELSIISSTRDASVGPENLTCACPCSDILSQKYTSDKFFSMPYPSQGTSTEKFKSVVVKTGYLYRYITPPMDINYGDSDANSFDPSARIYGLNYPIRIQEFFAGEDVKTTKKSLKIWLTCCYPSQETTRTFPCPSSDFAYPAPSSPNSMGNVEIRCNDKPLKLLTACISFGLHWPISCSVGKLIDRGTASQPRIFKSVVETHIPIGQISANGKILSQDLRNNLCLTDMILDGLPVKMPTPIYSNYPQIAPIPNPNNS